MISDAIHFAGFTVKIGTRVRQRCAWCGDIIEDIDLALMMQPEGSAPWQPWETGRLILVSGNGRGRTLLPHEEGAKLPEGTCADDDLKPESFEAWINRTAEQSVRDPFQRKLNQLSRSVLKELRQAVNHQPSSSEPVSPTEAMVRMTATLLAITTYVKRKPMELVARGVVGEAERLMTIAKEN